MTRRTVRPPLGRTATILVAVATGVAIQLLKGYTDLELGGYVLWFVLPTLVKCIQFAVLSVFVQADRKSTRLNSSHRSLPRMPSSA